MTKSPADCGEKFDHEPHAYKTPRGKIKACDGATGKLRYSTETPAPKSQVKVWPPIKEGRTVVRCRICGYEKYIGDPCGEPCI